MSLLKADSVMRGEKMEFWVGVENFAKISSAKICINHYTVLVGVNNSGKTFLMQLVQGVSEKIGELLNDSVEKTTKVSDRGSVTEYRISDSNVKAVVDSLNQKLEVEKEDIVKETFGREIPIGRLYIDIVMEKNEYYVSIQSNDTHEIRGFLEELGAFHEPWDDLLNNEKKNRDFEFLLYRVPHTESVQIISVYVYHQRRRNKSVKNLVKTMLDSRTLFMPASRTGILLLYREFFANRTDEALVYDLSDKSIRKSNDNFGGLSQPVYKFLRFLQTYSERTDFNRFKEELEFFETRLIEGHISSTQSGFVYQQKNSLNEVPMYLASSMINEIAPLSLALSSSDYYERLIIDEIEASLHPEKQAELVKFLNRLNNKGMKIIISTHSDTIAAKINNLYSISEYLKYLPDREKRNILNSFDIKEEELINTDNLFVYEFVIQKDGKSIVRQVMKNEYAGFQFDQFTSSAMNIYDEASKIGEIIHK